MPDARPLREERLRAILEILRREGSVRASDLSRRFRVSGMTVHRDLEELAARGLVQRVRGGAILARHEQEPSTFCVVCHAAVPQHTRVVLHLKDGSQRHLCCPHCALMFAARHRERVETILVRDLLYQHVVDARFATYVVDSEMVVCCRPSVLAFKGQEEAERFRKGFGGHVMSFAGVLAFLQNHTPHE